MTIIFLFSFFWNIELLKSMSLFNLLIFWNFDSFLDFVKDLAFLLDFFFGSILCMRVTIFIKPGYLFTSFTKIIKLAPHCSHSHTIAPLRSLCMIWPFAIGFKLVSFTRIRGDFTSHKPLLCDKSPWSMALLNLPQIFWYSIHSINYFLPFETFQASTIFKCYRILGFKKIKKIKIFCLKIFPKI